MMGGNALEVSSAFGGESRAGDEDGRSATQTDTSASLMGSMQGSYLNMIQTSAIFAFIQAFRYSPPWYLYNVVITTYLLLTIPLVCICSSIYRLISRVENLCDCEAVLCFALFLIYTRTRIQS